MKPNAPSSQPQGNDEEAAYPRHTDEEELDVVLGELRSLVRHASNVLDASEEGVSIARISVPSEEPAITDASEADLNDEAPASRNAAFEPRKHVDQPKRHRFWKNFQSRRKESVLNRASIENAFTASLRGKLVTWRATSWLFHRSSRKLDLITLASALVVGVIVAWSLNFSSGEAESASATPMEVVEPIPSSGEDLLLGQEQSQEVIRKFFAADSVAMISAMIRHPDIVKPLVDQWYAKRPPVPMTGLEFGESRVKHFGDSRYFLHFVLLPDETDFRPVAVEDTRRGFKVDWETAVGYQTMDWETLRQRKPAEKVYMRVIVTQDDYHNFEFIDANIWVCWRLSHPNADSVLYGYTKRHSKIDQALSEALDSNESKADYFILGLRYPESPQDDNLVYIDEVLQSKWVIDYQEGETHSGT